MKTILKQVEIYETGDGKRFSKKSAAIDHELWLKKLAFFEGILRGLSIPPDDPEAPKIGLDFEAAIRMLRRVSVWKFVRFFKQIAPLLAAYDAAIEAENPSSEIPF